MNLLIPYLHYAHLLGHPDPLFKEFTYGDAGQRARRLRNDLKNGDYIFFHTGVGGEKYITAYYIVDRIMDTAMAIKDKNIIAKYINPHILEGKWRNEDDDVIVFGDPITSKILERPLLFNKTLSKKLSLNIPFPKGRTETQAISSATRAWRELTDENVKVLLKAIKLSEKEGVDIETILSTDEVTEIIEKDIEKFVEKNTGLIGKTLRLIGRQLDTPVGRIDMLFEDKKGNPTVVELKLNKIGRDAINQLRKYMNWVKKETKRKIVGAIICEGVMPAFEEDFKKLKDIKIFCYGW